MDDAAILGVDRESLAAQTVFNVGRGAIRDVAVQGRLVIENGLHPQDREIGMRYCALQKRFLKQ
jgi:hypothetical protein